MSKSGPILLSVQALDRKTSPISPALRSLIIVRVSQLNGCAFCIDLNSSILLQRGVPFSKVEELEDWRKSALFSDEEKTVLEYTEAIYPIKMKIGYRLDNGRSKKLLFL